jgi:AhpC/TSA family
MRANHLSTADYRSILFFMLALLLGGGFLSDAAKTADQVASSGQEAIAVGAADHLNYRLFSDPRAEAMKKFGVAYQVDNNTVTYYKRKFYVDLESSSGQTQHILAVPAVFIVDRGGNIVFVRADPDYKVRMKGAEVLAAAKAAATTFDALRKQGVWI